MKLLRQVFSIALVAAFICFNTQSAGLHVHAAEHAQAAHQHGPALHHHDARVQLPVDEPRIAAVDADNTVILVRLSAAPVSVAAPTIARAVDVAAVERPTLTPVSGARVVARAHGPPSSRPDSLRAPPASQPV